MPPLGSSATLQSLGTGAAFTGAFVVVTAGVLVWRGHVRDPVLLAVGPFVLYHVFLMKVLCFALFALAFNLLLGYGGLLSFGHAAYFGMASYVSAYSAKVWGFDPALAILAGTLVAALLGLVFGALAIRRQGIYFAMITLALSQLIYFIYLQTPFTHGEDGIQGIPQGIMLGLFDLSWNVLCPGCSGVLDAHDTLKSLRPDDYHCGLCACGYECSVVLDIGFDSRLDRRAFSMVVQRLHPIEELRQALFSP